MQNSLGKWQVQAQGQIYEVEFEALKQWIDEGAVLPSDTVRQGDSSWQPVEKVAAFCQSLDSESAARSVLSAVCDGNPELHAESDKLHEARNPTGAFGEIDSEADKSLTETKNERGSDGSREHLNFLESAFRLAKYYKNMIRQLVRNNHFLR